MEHATEEEKNSMTYSKAREIVLERIFNIYSDNKPYKNNDNKIIIREDIPNDFWYSSNKGEKFKVRSSFWGDFRDVEWFSGYDPDICYAVDDGEYKSCLILKEHYINCM